MFGTTANARRDALLLELTVGDAKMFRYFALM